MPGPVSDSYDPEFSTAARASCVNTALRDVGIHLTAAIGSSHLRDIVEVAECLDLKTREVHFTERELRLLRFAVNRALESI